MSKKISSEQYISTVMGKDFNRDVEITKIIGKLGELITELAANRNNPAGSDSDRILVKTAACILAEREICAMFGFGSLDVEKAIQDILDKESEGAGK